MNEFSELKYKLYMDDKEQKQLQDNIVKLYFHLSSGAVYMVLNMNSFTWNFFSHDNIYKKNWIVEYLGNDDKPICKFGFVPHNMDIEVPHLGPGESEPQKFVDGKCDNKDEDKKEKEDKGPLEKSNYLQVNFYSHRFDRLSV